MFPGSVPGFCGLNMRASHFMGGEGDLETPVLSLVVTLPSFDTSVEIRTGSPEGCGTKMYFIWPTQCLDVLQDAVGWFVLSAAHHTFLHSLWSLKKLFAHLHHLSGPWRHWPATSNKRLQTLLRFGQKKTLYIRTNSQVFFLGLSHTLLGTCVFGVKMSFLKCLFFYKMMYE